MAWRGWRVLGSSSGDIDEFVERLQRSFRLTQYEARLYLAILRGARNPREASSMSGVPLPRIYDVVRVLESKGFVIPTEEGWYRAVPPNAVAVSEIARIEEEARRRAREVMDVASSLEALARRWEREETTVLEGISSVFSAAAELVDEAGSGYITVSNVFLVHAARLAGLVDALRSRGRLVVVAVAAPWVEAVPEPLKPAARLSTWLPDMAVTSEGVIIVVPSQRGEARGLLVRSPSYAAPVAEWLRGLLGSSGSRGEQQHADR